MEQEEKVQLDLANVSIRTLQEAFQRILLMEDIEPEDVPVRQMPREEITIEDRMTYIVKKLHSKKRLDFNDLFQKVPTRYEVITTFMALLEMLKLNQILVNQEGPNKSLLISIREKSA